MFVGSGKSETTAFLLNVTIIVKESQGMNSEVMVKLIFILHKKEESFIVCVVISTTISFWQDHLWILVYC